jgi:hypothetical protein
LIGEREPTGSGAIGVLDLVDALPDHIWNNGFSSLRLATQVAEGEEAWEGDELDFYQDRPQLAKISRILANLLVGPYQFLRGLLQKFRYLGPIRETPPRYFLPKSPDPSRWASGLATWDLLTTGPEQLVQRVNDWMGEAFRQRLMPSGPLTNG